MKLIKLITTAGMLLTASSVFAGYVTQCPPASALHHNTPGEPWTLDVEYQSKGWYVLEQPYYSKNSNLAITDKSILSVSIQQEEMLVVNPDNAYKHYNYGASVSLYFPATCAYVDKFTRDDGRQFPDSIVVKSSIYNNNAWSPSDNKWVGIYDKDSVNKYKKSDDTRDLIFKGVICTTTAGKPEGCPLKEWHGPGAN
jgi:hypothetical protein